VMDHCPTVVVAALTVVSMLFTISTAWHLMMRGNHYLTPPLCPPQRTVPESY
jgi:hypothetical protein